MGEVKVEIWRVGDQQFEVRGRFYLASCDGCGWIGSSELCGTDCGPWGDSDVYCPECDASGADCGKVAQTAVLVETKEGGAS